MSNNSPRYLPSEFIHDIKNLAEVDQQDSDYEWKIARLVENAYARGYSDGHARGYQEGWAAGHKSGSRVVSPEVAS